MKKLIFILSLCFSISAFSQNAKKTADGNFTAISKSKDSLTTGKTYTDKDGQIFPVYSTVKGKLFVVKTSPKTGKVYRSYLHIEGEMKD